MQGTNPGFLFIPCYLPIDQGNTALAAVGNVLIMCDQYHGLPLIMQAVEQFHDICRGFAVLVVGPLIESKGLPIYDCPTLSHKNQYYLN